MTLYFVSILCEKLFYSSVFTCIFPKVLYSSRTRHSSRCTFSLQVCRLLISLRNRSFSSCMRRSPFSCCFSFLPEQEVNQLNITIAIISIFMVRTFLYSDSGKDTLSPHIFFREPYRKRQEAKKPLSRS